MVTVQMVEARGWLCRWNNHKFCLCQGGRRMEDCKTGERAKTGSVLRQVGGMEEVLSGRNGRVLGRTRQKWF